MAKPDLTYSTVGMFVMFWPDREAERAESREETPSRASFYPLGQNRLAMAMEALL